MKFHYKQAIDLGFKREDHNDNVFFDQNGYQWFTVTLQLNKRTYLEWDSETKEIELVRLKKDKVYIKAKIKIKSEEHLKEVIEFFKDGE